jgi:hypothetical protein
VGLKGEYRFFLKKNGFEGYLSQTMACAPMSLDLSTLFFEGFCGGDQAGL